MVLSTKVISVYQKQELSRSAISLFNRHYFDLGLNLTPLLFRDCLLSEHLLGYDHVCLHYI